MTPSKLARTSKRPQVDSMDESHAKPAEAPSALLTFARQEEEK
jgi:hypothetical protein